MQKEKSEGGAEFRVRSVTGREGVRGIGVPEQAGKGPGFRGMAMRCDRICEWAKQAPRRQPKRVM